MTYSHLAECEAAGLDPDQVERAARQISRGVKMAAELGLSVFGGAGSGSLRTRDDPAKRQLVVADLGGVNWDGGDGGVDLDQDGLIRGEA